MLRSALNSARQTNSAAFEKARAGVVAFQQVGRQHAMGTPEYLVAEAEMGEKRRTHRNAVDVLKLIEARCRNSEIAF